MSIGEKVTWTNSEVNLSRINFVLRSGVIKELRKDSATVQCGNGRRVELPLMRLRGDGAKTEIQEILERLTE